VSAGMPRSGSTLLFNILREILSFKFRNRLSSGWQGDILSLKNGEVYLIKTHNIIKYYKIRADHIFYTYRDVRVAAVSQLRKFGQEITIPSLRAMIKQYEIAKSVCSACFKYEDFIQNTRYVVKECAEILGIEIDYNEICKKAVSIKPPDTGTGYSKDTLLHKGHYTNTGNNDWRSVIPESLQDDINREFSWWFEECGYFI